MSDCLVLSTDKCLSNQECSAWFAFFSNRFRTVSCLPRTTTFILSMNMPASNILLSEGYVQYPMHFLSTTLVYVVRSKYIIVYLSMNTVYDWGKQILIIINDLLSILH